LATFIIPAPVASFKNVTEKYNTNESQNYTILGEMLGMEGGRSPSGIPNISSPLNDQDDTHSKKLVCYYSLSKVFIPFFYV
jgi:hypothetical protein